jgi:hypothetical protein
MIKVKVKLKLCMPVRPMGNVRYSSFHSELQYQTEVRGQLLAPANLSIGKNPQFLF